MLERERVHDWKYYYDWFYQTQYEQVLNAHANVVREEVDNKGIICLALVS